MEFKPENQKAITVATNYCVESHDELWAIFEKEGIVEEYALEKIIPNITIESEEEPPQELKEDILKSLPCSFNSKNTNIQLINFGRERKILIEKNQYLHDQDAEKYIDLANKVVGIRSSEISAIGLNYTADFNLGLAKLQLLSDKVGENVPYFTQNITFEFVLPIEFKDEDLVATYKVKKVKGDGTEESPRIYNISANFHFKLTGLTSDAARVKRIEKILSGNYYKMFMEQCEGFLKINDSK